MTLNSLNGTECSTEIIKKINDIIAQKATISLSNLDSAGEQRFTTLAQGISDANDLITALTTVVGTKLSAEVSLQQNGYIKFSNDLIIQWLKNEATITVASKEYKIFQGNLPTSFTKNDFTNTLISNGGSPVVVTNGWCSSTRYTVGVYNPGISSESFDGYRWIAIGY